MHSKKLLARFAAATLVVILSADSRGQSAGPQHSDKTNAQGTLAVSATVVSSVGIVIDPDGQERVIVANADDAFTGVLSTLMQVLSPWPIRDREATRAYRLRRPNCAPDSNVTLLGE